MKQESTKSSNKNRVIASIALVSLVAGTAYEVNRLSAEPQAEKDCEPIPSTGNGTTSANEVRVEISPLPTSALLKWKQKGGTINDASCLDRTNVYGIVEIASADDVKNALVVAKENKLKISMAGARHSMGGHAFYRNALVLDMTKFNKMSLDEENMILTVESGATWHDIQAFLHPKYAVKAMQSTDIFTVGGSISVNAHGMDHQAGSVGGTIRSMRVMLADGSIVDLSRDENP